MNPEGNRHPGALNGRPRVPEDRYTPPLTGVPQTPLTSLDTYFLQMGQLMYPQYSYYGFPYPNNSFLGSTTPWRESAGLHPNFPYQANPYRNFYNPQNLRVVPRETREKTQAKFINLESDEEQSKQKNVPVPPSNIINKKNQKQTVVISLDDNSQENNQQLQKPPLPPKIQPLPPKPSKIQISIQKIVAAEKIKKQNQRSKEKEKSKEIEKEKQKQVSINIQVKTKLIAKAKPKQLKAEAKDLKDQKPSKERRRRHLETQRFLSKVDKQKWVEKSQKKKTEKVQKSQKLEKSQKPQKGDKTDKNDKNRKQPQPENKNKGEQVHTKQIAKYMESHGQIRHGKEFQSDIPDIRVSGNIGFNKWLWQKRNNLLRRETGPITY